MNKQTAVEWLVNQLQQTRNWQRVINEVNQSTTSVRDVIKQAKEMHKQEIINAYRDGRSDQQSEKPSRFYNRWAELYYNEQYGGKDGK